jgi:hypothetical protein
MLKFMSLFLILANIFGCSTQKKSEPDDSIFADVIVKKAGDKFTAQFMFYRSISEILNGRENKGFGKSPVVVDFPQINGVEMKVINPNEVLKVYLAEIENVEKDYTVTFMRKDGEYRAVVRINPNNLSQSISAEFKK